MRLFKFLLSILLLRRLPCGCFMSWVIRLAVWAGIATAIIRALKQYRGETQFDGAMREPSGWSSFAAEEQSAAEPAGAQTVSASFTASWSETDETQHETVETLTETVQESTGVWGAPVAETGSHAAETIPEPPFLPDWVQGDGSIDCPDDHPIKAKATSMIYYLPGTYHHSVTIPDVCFASPEDAVAAGYRAPRR